MEDGITGSGMELRMREDLVGEHATIHHGLDELTHASYFTDLMT